MKPASLPRRANQRLALTLGVFALASYCGIYAYYLLKS
jgi:hypothetical protein